MKTTFNIAVKKIILIFTLFAGLQGQLLMAKSPVTAIPARNLVDCASLAPVTPKEATFSDIVPEKAPVMVSMAPSMPGEATFEDDFCNAEISNSLLKQVAPVTPEEATFEELPSLRGDEISLKFIVPMEAEFTGF